jgi:hypothetical protein
MYREPYLNLLKRRSRARLKSEQEGTGGKGGGLLLTCVHALDTGGGLLEDVIADGAREVTLDLLR